VFSASQINLGDLPEDVTQWQFHDNLDKDDTSPTYNARPNFNVRRFNADGGGRFRIGRFAYLSSLIPSWRGRLTLKLLFKMVVIVWVIPGPIVLHVYGNFNSDWMGWIFGIRTGLDLYLLNCAFSRAVGIVLMYNSQDKESGNVQQWLSIWYYCVLVMSSFVNSWWAGAMWSVDIVLVLVVVFLTMSRPQFPHFVLIDIAIFVSVIVATFFVNPALYHTSLAEVHGTFGPCWNLTTQDQIYTSAREVQTQLRRLKELSNGEQVVAMYELAKFDVATTDRLTPSELNRRLFRIDAMTVATASLNSSRLELVALGGLPVEALVCPWSAAKIDEKPSDCLVHASSSVSDLLMSLSWTLRRGVAPRNNAVIAGAKRFFADWRWIGVGIGSILFYIDQARKMAKQASDFKKTALDEADEQTSTKLNFSLNFFMFSEKYEELRNTPFGIFSLPDSREMKSTDLRDKELLFRTLMERDLEGLLAGNPKAMKKLKSDSIATPVHPFIGGNLDQAQKSRGTDKPRPQWEFCDSARLRTPNLQWRRFDDSRQAFITKHWSDFLALTSFKDYKPMFLPPVRVAHQPPSRSEGLDYKPSASLRFSANDGHAESPDRSDDDDNEMVPLSSSSCRTLPAAGTRPIFGRTKT